MVKSVAIPVLFDSNILIDHLNGIDEAANEIGYFTDAAISAISWMELMVALHAKLSASIITQQEFVTAKAFLDLFPVLDIDHAVKARAATVRAASINTPPKIALPDAIIKATGILSGRIVVTRNTKDFPFDPRVRHPYVLETTPSNVTVLTPRSAIVHTIKWVALPP